MTIMETTRRPLILAAVISIAVFTALAAAGGARADQLTHWCRGGDPPLHASSHTTCDVAIALVNHLFNGPQLAAGNSRTISVRPPATNRSYSLQLVRRGDYVVATGTEGIWIRFYYDG
jgi:hypothetical protein